VTTRLMTAADAPALAALLRAHRDFLAPWEPVRSDGYFTDDGQRIIVEEALRQHAQGATLPHVIVADGRIVGRITLSTIVRGPFLSASLGYWVAPDVNGRGIATAAAGDIARIAFGELGLHRLDAGILPHNTASQKVLQRNGFHRYGLAPRYLKIAGEWRDHVLFQLLSE
jgi:[ribosomal protein S5]-alanine N-acetyltransferase